jgi:ribulose 1,5-bisphosphate synthetase/thiazole synthase
MGNSAELVNRRRLLAQAAQVGIGLGASATLLGSDVASTQTQAANAEQSSTVLAVNKPTSTDGGFYDVVVIGSGSGGLSAAIAAARNGAKVLMVERNGYLGGTMASGMGFLGFLDRHGRPVVGGFATEIVDRLKQVGASLGVRRCPKHYSMVIVKPDFCKIVASDLCDECGVDVLLHCYLTAATVEDGRITKAVFDCAGNAIEVRAKVFVDATGDGTLAHLSGAAYQKGRANGDLQPPSILYTLGGVDKEAFFAWIEKHPEELSGYTLEYLRESPNYTFVTLGHLFKELSPKGEWPIDIWAFICINSLNDGQVVVNGPRMLHTDATNPYDLTKAERKGARQAVAFTEMLRKHVGGFEHACVSHINDTIGIRETRRIVGEKMLTLNEALSASVPDDAVALAAYPIDIHSSKDATSTFHEIDRPFGIPYPCLVSKTHSNLMMAGRCISVDSDVFGSTRVIGTCLAVGEAAGVGAALTIRDRRSPREVDSGELRQILARNGGVLSV